MNLSHGIAQIDPTTGVVVDQWKTDQIGYASRSVPMAALVPREQESGASHPTTGQTDVSERIDGTPVFISPTGDGLWVGTYEGDLVRFVVRPSVIPHGARTDSGSS